VAHSHHRSKASLFVWLVVFITNPRDLLRWPCGSGVLSFKAGHPCDCPRGRALHRKPRLSVQLSAVQARRRLPGRWRRRAALRPPCMPAGLNRRVFTEAGSQRVYPWGAAPLAQLGRPEVWLTFFRYTTDPPPTSRRRMLQLTLRWPTAGLRSFSAGLPRAQTRDGLSGLGGNAEGRLVSIAAHDDAPALSNRTSGNCSAGASSRRRFFLYRL
jgi:hypothetical protein